MSLVAGGVVGRERTTPATNGGGAGPPSLNLPYFTFLSSRSTPPMRAVSPVTTPSASILNVTVVFDCGLPRVYVVPD